MIKILKKNVSSGYISISVLCYAVVLNDVRYLLSTIVLMLANCHSICVYGSTGIINFCIENRCCKLLNIAISCPVTYTVHTEGFCISTEHQLF